MPPVQDEICQIVSLAFDRHRNPCPKRSSWTEVSHLYLLFPRNVKQRRWSNGTNADEAARSDHKPDSLAIVLNTAERPVVVAISCLRAHRLGA